MSSRMLQPRATCFSALREPNGVESGGLQFVAGAGVLVSVLSASRMVLKVKYYIPTTQTEPVFQ